MKTDLLTKFMYDIKNSSLDGTKALSESENVEHYIKFLREEKKMQLDEVEAILRYKGNLEIASCAGSGKTTCIIHKIIIDWLSGALGNDSELNKVWLCTFLHKGADDLRKTLRKAMSEYSEYAHKQNIHFTPCNPSPHTISTMHSEFYQVVRSVEEYGKGIKIIDEADNRALLAEVVAEQGMGYKGRSERSNIVDDLLTALAYTRNRIDNSRYDVPLYTSLNLKSTSIDRILESWKLKRQAKGVWDFEDLQEKVYEECKAGNPAYLEAVTSRYNYLYIDEFQDTSQMQYAIIKYYAKNAKKIIVIGDDDQTIYTWRGSSGDILRERFVVDFKPQVMKLSVNYRCPANILDPIVTSITKNKKRIPKEIRAFKDGGDFSIGAYSDYNQMSAGLVESVREDIKAKTESIAVLCRTNTDAVLPALELIKAGIAIQVSDEKMTLNTRLGRSVRGVFKLFLDRGSRDMANALKLYCPNEPANAEQLVSICRNNNITLWDNSPDELRISQSKLYTRIADWIDWHDTMPENECLVKILDDYINNAFNNTNGKRSQYNEELKGVFTAVKELVIESEYSEIFDIYDEFAVLYDRLIKSVKGKKEAKNAQVEVATVHEYKGAEVDSVYVWNDTKGMFPHIKGGEKATADSYEEERRIHYIACTRAKKKNKILTIQGVQGDFLLEMKTSIPRRKAGCL